MRGLRGVALLRQWDRQSGGVSNKMNERFMRREEDPNEMSIVHRYRTVLDGISPLMKDCTCSKTTVLLYNNIYSSYYS
jgi:hypothetical protein